MLVTIGAYKVTEFWASCLRHHPQVPIFQHFYLNRCFFVDPTVDNQNYTKQEKETPDYKGEL